MHVITAMYCVPQKTNSERCGFGSVWQINYAPNSVFLWCVHCAPTCNTASIFSTVYQPTDSNIQNFKHHYTKCTKMYSPQFLANNSSTVQDSFIHIL